MSPLWPDFETQSVRPFFRLPSGKTSLHLIWHLLVVCVFMVKCSSRDKCVRVPKSVKELCVTTSKSYLYNLDAVTLGFQYTIR